jgi:hypothetical protein
MIRKKHGMRKCIEYACWVNMKQRCYNPKSPIYKYYGGSGVTVCERWKDDFAAFLEDVGPRRSLEYSLDRYPNARGNYEPGNVRWATDEEQARNRPGYNVNVEWRGVIKTVTQWEKDLGFGADVLANRLRTGWDVSEAFTAPVSPLVRPSKRSKHPGVVLHECGSYCAYVGVGKSRKYIGMFKTIEQSQKAIQKWNEAPLE